MKLSKNPLHELLSYGNSKLPKSTAIFNLGSATNHCPNKGSKRCQVNESECYAISTETRFLTAKKFRDRQLKFWESIPVSNWIHYFNLVQDAKINKVKKIRFNVSSDLRSQSDINRIDRIAKLLDIPVYLYTASSFLDFSNIDNTIINCSNLDLWNRYRNKNNFNFYTVVKTEKQLNNFISQGYKKCKNDCSICNYCSQSTGKIVQLLH